MTLFQLWKLYSAERGRTWSCVQSFASADGAKPHVPYPVLDWGSNFVSVGYKMMFCQYTGTRLGFELCVSRLHDDVVPIHRYSTGVRTLYLSVTRWCFAIHRVFDTNTMEQCPHSEAYTSSASEETSHVYPKFHYHAQNSQPIYLCPEPDQSITLFPARFLTADCYIILPSSLSFSRLCLAFRLTPALPQAVLYPPKCLQRWRCATTRRNLHLLFYIHGSVHRESNLTTLPQDAIYSVYYISVGSSTCFGCWHPWSGACTTVITASGID